MKITQLARTLFCLLAPVGAALAQPATAPTWPTQPVRCWACPLE